MSDGQKAPHLQGTQDGEGRQPIFLLPGVLTALAGLMAAIHIASTLIFNEESRVTFAIWFAFLPFRLLQSDQVPGGLLPLLWTPFTHAFLHASWEHLIINLAWLAIFGTPVARRYGTIPTLAIFLVTSAVGALAFAATSLNQVQFLLGASGGIAGFTGVAVRIMFQPILVTRDKETGQQIVLGRRLASLRETWANPRARNFSLFWVVLNAAVPLLPLLIGQDVGIAWQAHLGGFFAGLFLAPLFERRPAAAVRGVGP